MNSELEEPEVLDAEIPSEEMVKVLVSPADLLSQLEVVKQKALVEALKDSQVAIDDWLNLYAEEECNPDRVYEARKRIDDAGGTLAYIAGIQSRTKAALAKVTP